MSGPTEDEDQIFSGAALGEDGAVSRGKEILPEIPPPPGAPHHAPAPAAPVLESVFENDLVPRSHFQDAPPLQLASVELAERAPRPPSDFTPMLVPDRPVRPPSPDIRWGRWFLLLSLLAIVGGGVFIVVTARATVDRLLAPGVLDRFLPRTPRPTETGKVREPDPAGQKETRVGTPAPSLLVISEPSGATVLVGGTEVGKTPWAGDNVWPKGPLRIEVRKAGFRSWETTVDGGAERTVDATLRKR